MTASKNNWTLSPEEQKRHTQLFEAAVARLDARLHASGRTVKVMGPSDGPLDQTLRASFPPNFKRPAKTR